MLSNKTQYHFSYCLILSGLIDPPPSQFTPVRTREFIQIDRGPSTATFRSGEQLILSFILFMFLSYIALNSYSYFVISFSDVITARAKIQASWSGRATSTIHSTSSTPVRLSMQVVPDPFALLHPGPSTAASSQTHPGPSTAQPTMSSMTVPQLKQFLVSKGEKGLSRLKKDELLKRYNRYFDKT